MRTLTEKDVRHAITDTVNDIIEAFKDAPDTDREDVIERMREDADALFGSLVQHGRVDQYDVDDLVATAQPCATIIKVAQHDAWVEDDYGLWEGLTYGVLASIAYFSLEHCLYEELKRKGYDTNDEQPFAAKVSTEAES